MRLSADMTEQKTAQHSKEYLAAVFDVRGFVRINPKTYHYAVYFNFYDSEKELWENIKKAIDLFVPSKIYRSRKRKKEYQLYIGGKRNVYKFLSLVYDFSNRKRELKKVIDVLAEKCREEYV